MLRFIKNMINLVKIKRISKKKKKSRELKKKRGSVPFDYIGKLAENIRVNLLF